MSIFLVFTKQYVFCIDKNFISSTFFFDGRNNYSNYYTYSAITHYNNPKSFVMKFAKHILSFKYLSNIFNISSFLQLNYLQS
jgi:hypothetical protein